MTEKPWCVEPFVGLSHTTDGWHQLCCIGQVDRTSTLNTYKMSPIEFMNSDYMKTIRKDMIEHNISKEIKYACKSCLINERSDVISRRINQNQKFNTDNAVSYAKSNNFEIETSHLQYVNLKILGNICNLKCIMCNPNSSSKIAAEYKKYNITHVDKSIKVSYDQSNKNKYFNDISEILKSIDRFSLIGGEAFVHPDFEEIFELLTSNINSKNIELFIITNGTVLPDYVLKNAYKFRKLTLNFSIDGIGKKAEYIRNGTVWKTYDYNLKKALSSDVHVVFTCAIQMLNIGYLEEIYYYLDRINSNLTNRIGWNNLVTFPALQNSLYLPTKVKENYKNKYKKINFYSVNANIDKTLEILNTVETPLIFNSFINQMKKLDKIRGNSLPEIFPEFEEYYFAECK